ncbi:MAG: ATPase domain-containing protein [Methanobacteriota archaeon]
MADQANKETTLKEFMTLPGVGVSKAKALYDGGFASLEQLSTAKCEDIVRCKGFNERSAVELLRHLNLDGAAKPKASKEEALVQSGLSLYGEGKWGQALQEMDKVLADNPKNDRALLIKGDIYFERERFDRAEDAYRQLVEVAQDSDMAQVKLGDAILKQGRKVEAEEQYSKALRLNPENQDAQDRLESQRIMTYVSGLDERMDGGIPSRYVVLVAGRAGSMKSSLVFNILYNHARHERRKSLYITLEQGRKSLIRHMSKLGFDVAGTKNLVINDIEDLVVVDMARLRKEATLAPPTGVDWINSLLTQIKKYKEAFGCDLLAIDSLSAIYSLSEFKNPRAELFMFFERLRDLGVTVFLITEMPDKEVFGQYGVEEFLADGIVHLKTEKYGNKANLFLGVVKMRETKHDRDYFPLIVEKGNFEIVAD